MRHEFRDFLFKYPETFTIDGLGSHCPNMELHFQPDVKIDPQDTQTLLDFLAQCIEVKGPILVEQLFQIVSCNLPESIWSNLFNTPIQLSSFLRLFSDSFHIQSNLVTLLQTPKISQKHITAQMDLIKEHSVKEQQVNNEEVKNARNIIKVEPQEKNSIEKITSQNCQENISPTSPIPPPQNAPSSPRSISDRLRQPKLQQKQMEAKQQKSLSPEPAIVPDKNGVDFRLGKTSKPVDPQIQDLPVSQETESTKLPPTKPTNNNQTLKQRINSLVLKTLQENTGRDRQTMLNQQQPYSDDQKNSSANNEDKSWPFRENKVVVGFDCEGINLGVKGQLTLAQIATMTGFAYVFDLISCPEMIQAGLKRILESTDVIKVVHDCRNDSVNLFRQFNITLNCVFDTQAAHAVLTYQESGRPVYKAKSVALNALCEIYGASVNPMKDQLKNIYRRDQKYWSRRPLTREMILYASADVLSLINDKIYYPMVSAIKEENRKLMVELCDEQIFLHINPDDVKLKKRQRKTETEVKELRLKLSQPTKSVVLSNREVRLLRYIELTEEEKEKLKSSAKVAKKLEKLESLGQERDNDSSDEDGDNDDYPSFDSDMTSPRNSEPTSLTESMQLVDSILNDNKIDRLDKIDKLESILSSAALLPSDGDIVKCSCNCHTSKINGMKPERVLSPTNEYVTSVGQNEAIFAKENHSNISTQTLSTGDIVVTKIFFQEPTD
ncbi:uncharacterized protein LOC115877248 [Sitophilus oryzae]|uniref:Uncharacterized protein LOC115877248 n=1 Tax=Sitophilus oryzae TaxID=7048 RepID=A0A6J2XD55_SITOR|nr:uncharacterized protein LOC115877248 [Sitophilus oryzae]